MGGKKKTTHAQPRTKDNLKPSSSEKAAQFLVNQTGGLGLPFPLLAGTAPFAGTFSVTHPEQQGRITGFVPVPQDPDAVGLDPRLLSILRRLEKRDAVTKQKALRELCELLQPTEEQALLNIETSAVVATLPFWSRIYTRLSSDHDRKVRELVQMAMSVLAARVGREIGPYIKQILPVWAFATVDFHEPAASWANQGLSDTFPNAKRSDAYKVCARSLLDLLESKLSEEISMVSTVVNEKGTRKQRIPTLSEDTGLTAASDLDNWDDNAWVKLAATLRFTASVATELGELPSDSRHLERLHSLLAPENLWSRVAQVLERQLSGASSDRRLLIGNSSLVHSSLYKLCTTLCTNRCWQDWMETTHEGTQLASYLCVSTLGQLGLVITGLNSPPTLTACKLIPPPPSSVPVPSCYTQCWEAALSCLANIPSDIVWSTINWESVLVPQLEQLLSPSGVPYAKQVYPSLLSLLSKFPLVYGALTKTQEAILMRLFVDTTLSGLEASLSRRASTEMEDLKPPTPVHADPGLSISVVTGILECARFLIDKLATAYPNLSPADCRARCPLLHAILHQVVLRLLADSLDVLDDNAERVFLVCSQPATYRQTYLNVIFIQIAQLCGHLGRSELISKLTILEEIHKHLIRWISSTPLSNDGDPTQTPTVAFRLGSLDPLRLLKLIDQIATVGRLETSDVANRGNHTFTQLEQDAFEVRASWCINLLDDVAQHLLDELDRESLQLTLRSCLYLIFLCLQGYLPSDHMHTISSFGDKLFNVILPGLPTDVHSSCWSKPVVHGVIRAWCDCSSMTQSNVSFVVRFRFLQDLFPALLQMLPYSPAVLTENLHNLLSDWCCNSLDEIFNTVKTSSTVDISSSLSLLHLTLSTLYNPNSRRSIQLMKLSEKVLQTVTRYLTEQLPDESDVLLAHSLSPVLLRNLTLCVSVLLETVSQPSTTAIKLDYELVNHWQFQLARLLFALYSVQHYVLVTKLVSPNSNLTDLLSPSCDPSEAGADDELLYSRSLDLSDVIEQAEQLLFAYLSLTRQNFKTAGSVSDFTYSLYGLLMNSVVSLRYVPAPLIRFAERLRKSVRDTSLASYWLSQLTELIKQAVEFVISDYTEHVSMLPPSRHLLPGLGCSIGVTHFGPLIRLHQLGLRLDLPHDLISNADSWNNYLQCLGLLRAWLCGLGDTYDPCTAFGWPIEKRSSDTESDMKPTDLHLEPARSVFGQVVESYASELGRLWYRSTVDIPLDKLFELLQVDEHSFSPFACTNLRGCVLVNSLLNAVMLNRLRTVHPNLWPLHCKLIASCTDDPNQPESSWSEEHLFSNGFLDQPSCITKFNKLCELYLPAGVVRRCLPRQELLGRLKSLALSPTTLNASESDTDCARASRILELCSSLVGIRTVSPVYVTTFLSLVTEDFQAWLTELGESRDENQPPTLWASQSGFNASLATMEFFESLLLLWQPWQWRPTHVTDKGAVTNHLGLIQLSLRLQQLRPSLTRSQWDFVMCLTVTWICAAVNRTSGMRDRINQTTLFAFHVFRVAAALGSIFIEKFPLPTALSYFITLAPLPQKTVAEQFEGDEWDDDLDAEAEELSVEEIDLLDEGTPKDQVDQETDNNTQLLDAFSDEYDEPEATLVEDEDDSEDSSHIQQPMLPRRGRPPLIILTDWEQFFSSHFYSSLLPVILKWCLPQPGLNQTVCESATPVHLEAACAAFATCPAVKLVRILTDQPQLILEYLMDLDISGSRSPVYPQLIRSRASSVNELTPGLRASFDLASRLFRFSPYQSGQLLGHVLLTRLICTHTKRTDCDKTFGLSSYLIHRLPSSWLAALYDKLPSELEQDLILENLNNNWGRGSRVLCYLTKFSLQDGWYLDTRAHQSLLRYLLAWDGVLSLFTCTGSQGRARLQRALLGSAAPLFDRLVLCLGLLMPPPGNLETFLNIPSRLEPDERLMLPVSASRADLIAALSLISPSRQRRPMRLSVPLASGDDQEWRDPFAPDDPLLALSGGRMARDISHLAVRVLRRFLAEAPALFRSWFNRLSCSSAADSVKSDTVPSAVSPLTAHKPGRLRQLANTIENVVSRHFSPGLARDEVVLVQYKAQLRQMKRDDNTSKGWFNFLSTSNEVGSISIRSRPLSREVIATYQVTEEHSMEMSIQLPANYPLGLATVTCDRAVAISSQQGHVWSVQLSVFINNQNGSILDGIDLWQRNVRKKFEGVEECAICYSVVHNTNFSLPKMQCHTCRKLFHYACMYRWFTTSRNPACPLCRNMFFGPSGRPT